MHSNNYLDRLTALSKRTAIKLIPSTSWSQALRPRYLFGWDDYEADESTRRQSPTAWLDGARGISALQVYFYHFVANGYAVATHTYGSTPEDNHYYQHPLLRPIWNAGAGSVCNFFVISGFVLTTNSFLLIRDGKFDKLYRGLCSSILRRWFRLWLPVIAVGIPMIFFYQYWPFDPWFQPKKEDSLWKEALKFFSGLDEIVQPLTFTNSNGIIWTFGYVYQAWTIPLEFHCSMVCYIAVMLVSRMPSFRRRAAVIAFLAFYSMHHAIYWTSLFFVGMLLADWTHEQRYGQHSLTNGIIGKPTMALSNGAAKNLTTHSSNHKDSKQSHPTRSRFTIWSAFNLIIFFIGYYLSGMPMQMPDENPYIPKPGYEFLYRLQPPRWLINLEFQLRWYHSLSAICLVTSISQSTTLRRMCESRFAQWLGDISFALYLVHMQIMTMFSGHVRNLFRWACGNRAGWDLGYFLFELVVISFISFATAAFVRRHVDAPTVRFSRWIDEFLTGEKRPRRQLDVRETVPDVRDLDGLPSSRSELRNY